MKKIIAIYTDDTRERRYIESLSKREDGKYLALTTTNKNDAMDFDTQFRGACMVSLLHDPHCRKWQVNGIEIQRKQIFEETSFSKLQ